MYNINFKMPIKFHLIAAACENMGTGKNNDLPWRLKKEMAHFTKLTSETNDGAKKNVVLMGRRTWDSIPKKFKPLQNRINFVLSRSKLNLSDFKNTYSFTSLDEVVGKLEEREFQNLYENVWVIGGTQIYELTMKSKYFYSLYLTKVLKDYDCDTFFPKLNVDELSKISDPRVPEAVQEENGVQFIYNVYKNLNYNK